MLVLFIVLKVVYAQSQYDHNLDKYDHSFLQTQMVVRSSANGDSFAFPLTLRHFSSFVIFLTTLRYHEPQRWWLC